MLGAIIGDIVGSVYEFHNTKDYNFRMFTDRSNFTDDSIMTVAVAEWLLYSKDHDQKVLADIMRRYGDKYKCPMGGYGSHFGNWLIDPKMGPYDSCGNGSAMRASAVGWMFDTLEETEHVAELSASVTHNHPEGIKGAQATAAAIFLGRNGFSKAEIKQYIEKRYGYDLSRSYEDVKATYEWGALCQNTVPEAIIAFLASTDFEDSIRKAISMGGDSDTVGCINGGIAEAFYKDIPVEMSSKSIELLPEHFKTLIKRLSTEGHYSETCPMISFTPARVDHLYDNQIFVFGSNLEGHHAGGAARIALDKFEAIWGQGVGLQGRCYAIPTMQGGPDTIRPYVDDFIQFAKDHPELTFLVTRIGCGIAGFKDEEIAPLFRDALKVENIRLPKSFYLVLIGRPSASSDIDKKATTTPKKSLMDRVRKLFGEKDPVFKYDPGV